MAYLTESQARARLGNSPSAYLAVAKAFNPLMNLMRENFDIFLSHSTKDAEVVFGVKAILEASGKSVYVDWIEDASLDREKVNGTTADILRKRMAQCDALFYLYSQNSTQSRWMPWELGYFDALKSNVAILPIVPTNGILDFEREEYLELYPKVDFANVSTTPTIFINKNRDLEMSGTYKPFDEWRAGEDKLRPNAA